MKQRNAEELAHDIDSDARQAGNGWNCRCPAHSDTNPSLSIHDGDKGRVIVHCHAGCPQQSVIDALKELGLWERNGNGGPKAEDAQGGNGESDRKSGHASGQAAKSLTLDVYATRKKLDIKFLKSLGVCDDANRGMRISYRNRDGEETAVRYRVAMEGDERFRWKLGSKTGLYGLWRSDQARKAGCVVIVEGESDCHTLWERGVPAIGLPGANGWKEDRDASQLDGIERIYAVIEPDQGGKAVKKCLGKSRIRDRVWLVNLGHFKDPSQLHITSPKGFDGVWRAALRNATPLVEVLASEREADWTKAWDICEELANKPNLLDLFIQDLARQGVVVEKRVAQLIYLCLTSRLLDQPISVAIKGPSSVGKSHIVEKVSQFFPDSAYFARTAISERALAYTDEPLQHRTFILYEANGMGEVASYLTRSLLSEGGIKYESVQSTKDGISSIFLEREGPTNLIVTTTAISLHAENETRLLSITIADTREQTARIMLQTAINNEREKEPIPPKWLALPEWLSLSDDKISIPFGDKLAKTIPPLSVRLHRDFRALLNLIRTHALLHKKTRARDQYGRIVATLEDYAVVRELVADLFAAGIEAMVPETVRATVQAIATLCSVMSAALLELGSGNIVS